MDHFKVGRQSQNLTRLAPLLVSIPGSVLISLAVLINLSLMPESFHESMWGLYLLGSLLFIPGAHYTYIAYQAYYGTPGYTYEDIPIMD